MKGRTTLPDKTGRASPLAETVRKARERKGLSQERLAALSGLSRQYIAAVEKGANVSVQVLERIATVLELKSLPLGSAQLKITGKSQVSRVGQVKRAIHKAAQALADAENLLTPRMEDDRRDRDMVQRETRPIELIRDLLALAKGKLEAGPTISLILVGIADELLAIHAHTLDEDQAKQLRALAEKERVNAFWRLGRYPEALRSLDLAESELKEIAAEHLKAVLKYLRAAILSELGQHDEALAQIGKASAGFQETGDSERTGNAEDLRGSILFRAGRVRDAYEIWQKNVERAESDKSGADSERLSCFYNNLGQCCTELERFRDAGRYLKRALELAQTGQHRTVAAKVNWNLALLAAAQQDFEKALGRLDEARRELLVLGMTTDAAIASLDLINILISLERFDEIPEVSEELVQTFAAAGLHSKAVSAVALMNEAARGKRLRREDVSFVREIIQQKQFS